MTETGRSSTTVMKAPIRPHPMGLSFHGLTKHGDVGADIRTFLIVDPGTCFIEVDKAAAEPRICAILSKDDKLLQMFDEGLDVHRWTAAYLFNKDEKDIDKKTKEGEAIRFTGKTCRNGYNFDMGKGELSLDFNAKARRFHINASLTEWGAGELLKKFDALAPGIKGIFHREVQECLAKPGRILVNPFGRPRQFLEAWGDKLFKGAYAQIPQSTVRDDVGYSIIRFRKRYQERWKEKPHIIVEAHDAIVVRELLERERETAMMLDEEFSRPIDFSKCSLPRGILKTKAEVKISYTNYSEFKDYVF